MRKCREEMRARFWRASVAGHGKAADKELALEIVQLEYIAL